MGGRSSAMGWRTYGVCPGTHDEGCCRKGRSGCQGRRTRSRKHSGDGWRHDGTGAGIDTRHEEGGGGTRACTSGRVSGVPGVSGGPKPVSISGGAVCAVKSPSLLPLKGAFLQCSVPLIV